MHFMLVWMYDYGVIRIFGAGYWRKGEATYERENKVQR